MNEFNSISTEYLWISGAVAMSFLAGCVYRLCSVLSRGTPEGETYSAGIKDLNQRHEQEMQHVQEIYDEMIQIRNAVANRAVKAVGTSIKPPALALDPFRLAKSGASIDVLMERCRLSRAEAELVFSVHGAGSGHTPKMAPAEEQSALQAYSA